MDKLVKIFLLVSVVIFSCRVSAISKLYRGGEVGILVKNDLPCFYIRDPENASLYSLVGGKKSNIKNFEWTYVNQSDIKIPSEESCILWGEDGFSEKQPFLLNTPYGVTFSRKHVLYHSDFCLTQKDSVTILQKVRGTECYDPPKSKWQSFKELFH